MLAQVSRECDVEGGVDGIIPEDCMTNDNTSPATKILVSQFRRMTECFSPCTRRMMRPRIMYILAAKRAGETSSRVLCMM